jgi:hypothetical protein
MEHLTLEKIAMLVGQMQLSILNLQSYIEKLEKEIEKIKSEETK